MEELLRDRIGGCFRQTRTSKRLTLRTVAERAGISLGYLSEVERGRKEASSEMVRAICSALGITLDDLLRVEDTR